MGYPPSSIMSSQHAFVLVAFPFFLLVVSSQLSLGSVEDLIQRCAPFHSNCGGLNVSFPFSQDPKGECGLGIIRCVNHSTVPLINAGDDHSEDVEGFEVKNIDYNQNTVVIHDRKFTNLIQRNSCNELQDFTVPPISGNLTFQLISPISIHFEICKGDPNASIHEEVNGHDLSGIRRCGEYDLYFSTYDVEPSSPLSSANPRSRCTVVKFPVDISDGGLLQRLSGGFSLQWKLPQPCYQFCDNGTSPCLSQQNHSFLCVVPNHEEKGKPKKIIHIIIGVVVAAVVGILLTCLVFFLIYYRRHRRREVALLALPKTRSTSSSLTPLSASITSYPSYGVPLFTYEELEEATDNFNSDKELGDGGFGTVYHGKLLDGRDVAVKRLYENNWKRVEQFLNEVEILARLRHQNLVTLYGCTSRHSRELLLVYEFISNGTVADHLHGDRAEPGSLPWHTRMSIAIETAKALSFLHASDIIHRDVKTNNILLCKNFQVKVADFGLSRLFPNDVTHVSTAPQGTPGYVDPEYHQSYRLTDKSDVYSFGVVLIELISSKPAVDITRHRHEINLANLAINKIQNRAVHELVDPCLGYESDDAVRGMMTSVAALAFRCLQCERELRPSMDEVLEVLKGIESEDYKNIMDEGDVSEVIDIPMDHGAAEAGPFKNNTPPPVAVTPDSFSPVHSYIP